MRALMLSFVLACSFCAQKKHPILVAEDRANKCEIMLAECVRGLPPGSPLDYRDGGAAK